MNSIKKILRTDSFMYGAFALSLALAAFFIILPLVSDISSETHGPSFTAGLVTAFGGDGGGDGGGGGDSGGGCCGDGETPTDPGAGDGGGSIIDVLPICTLAGTPSIITQGETVTLSWTTQFASSVSIDQGIGAVAMNGTRSVAPTTNTTYTLTASGAGSVTCAQTITVIPVVVAAPVCTLTANPTTITDGQSVTLSWTTQDASSVSINQGVGAVALNGTKTVTPSSNTTYTITATGAGGTVTCVTSVTVIPVVVAAPVCTLTANPTTITDGQSVTLSWTTQDASSVSINQGVGAVALSGTRSVTPTTNTTYTITATGAGGTVTCVTSVTVIPVVVAAPVCTLTANPTTITDGQSVTLSWTTQDASSVSINQGVGAVALSGTRSVTPTTNTTYTLTATGAGGTVTCSAPITVTPIVVPTAPTCTLTATPTSLTSGQSATLSWTTQNASSVSINQGVGAVALSGTRSVAPTTNTTYTLTATGAGGTVTCSAPITVTPIVVPTAPTCALTASPSSITNGQSTTLTWTTQNATNVSINQNVGTVALNGTRSVAPTTNTTYTLTATGAGGTITCSAPVTVTTVVPSAPVCTLDAAPLTIVRGDSAILSWTTQNASTVVIDQSMGAVALNGTRSVTPSSNTTYTLTATGAGGTVNCIKTITVTEPETPQPLTCDAFTATPGTLNAPGTTTLTWATSNATSVSINNGVGTVLADGSRSVFVSANTTYTLTATRGTETKTCTVGVTIVPDVVVPRCDAFTVSPSSVKSGASVTLAWSTTNASNVSISPSIGSVSVDGTRTETVTTNTTYTLTATNGNATTSCQASVSIESSGGGGGGGGGSSSPRCTLKASDTSVKSGDKVTLSWKNTRTNEILLKDSRGNTLIDTTKSADEKKYNEDADSIDVRPTKSTAYTLTAFKGSKKKTCTVDINVENVSVTSTRTRDPLVAGISLSRVPYTGFDAGPLMTAFFYILLVVWALAVAYILVIRRESVFGVSLKSKIMPMHHTGTFAPARNSWVAPTLSHVVTAPRVSLMEPPMRTIPAPRTIPVGVMASKNAALGYDEYYAAVPTTHVKPELISETPFVAATAGADLNVLEARAHDAQVLISTDALHFITAQSGTEAEHFELLDMIIATAKAQFPKEDGWVVVNKERILSLLK